MNKLKTTQSAPLKEQRPIKTNHITRRRKKTTLQKSQKNFIFLFRKTGLSN